MFVYSITNQITQQKFIGISLIPLSKRKQYHIEQHEQLTKLLQSEAYTSMHSESIHKLSQAFLKYGIDNFTWEVLEHCEKARELCKRQLYYITLHDSYENGYNNIKGLDSISYFELDDSPFHHEEYDGKFKSDNMRGSANVNSKLSDEDVKQIRKLLTQNVLSHAKIAKQFNVAKSTIIRINKGNRQIISDEYTKSSKPQQIAKGRATGYTPEQINNINQHILSGQYSKPELMELLDLSEHKLKTFIKKLKDDGHIIKFKKPNPSLTDEQVREVKLLIQAGSMSQNAIAKQYGVSKIVIAAIRKGETYTHVVI
ncbi:helix-turn-helix domain-containing protein [Planococcus sp. SIMBA_143]